MKRKILGVLLALLLINAGCAKMNFVKGEPSNDPSRTYEEWHHIGILQLVAFSDPVNMGQRCEETDWNHIKTSIGPVQALVHWFVGGLYGPYEVKYSCKRPIGSAVPVKQNPKKKPI